MTKENKLFLSCISGNPSHYSIAVFPLETKLGLCSHNPQISIDLHMEKESQNKAYEIHRNSQKNKHQKKFTQKQK